MNSDRSRILALCAVTLLLPGCVSDGLGEGGAKSTFGEANRQTLMAQVVDPDPVHEALVPETSAEHAAQAADRYARDAVKKPDRVRSTVSTSSSVGTGR